MMMAAIVLSFIALLVSLSGCHLFIGTTPDPATVLTIDGLLETAEGVPVDTRSM